jgi:AraC-like DNA-binding protein
MDTLSDLLSSVRFQGFMYGLIDCRAPWGIQIPAVESHVRLLVAVRGGCYLNFGDDLPPLALAAGELVLCHNGAACKVQDAPESACVGLETINQEDNPMIVGGTGALSSLMIGCFVLSAHKRNPFWAGLPSVLHLKSEHLQAAPGLEATLKLLTSELSSRNIGGQMLVSRLTDALFVQIIRTYVLQVIKCPSEPVWLKCLVDPQIGAALNMIHANPSAPWTVAKLANAVNMSRTSFSNKFTALVTASPMEYLNTWRMQKAVTMLHDGEDNLTEIGNRIGYSSRAAFAKAFKREFRQAPGEYKRQLLQLVK